MYGAAVEWSPRGARMVLLVDAVARGAFGWWYLSGPELGV